MASNTTIGPAGSRSADFALYERLPAGVRTLMQGAPTAISADERLRVARRYGLDADELVEATADTINSFYTTHCRRTYGPDHPQASGDAPDTPYNFADKVCRMENTAPLNPRQARIERMAQRVARRMFAKNFSPT